MFLHDELLRDLEASERKAWEALAKYKFWMFGYWAADVVRINRRLRLKQPNPFSALVATARSVLRERAYTAKSQ